MYTNRFSLSADRPNRLTSNLAARAGRARDLFSALEARQLMAGDLGIEISDNFDPLAFYTGGETITVPVVVRNNFANPNPAGTQMRVTIRMVDASENIAISRTVTTAAPLAPDAATNLNIPVPVLAYGEDVMLPGQYTILASVEFVAGDDEFNGDNVAREDGAVTVRWVFGNVDGRNGLTFRSADPDGTSYSITASGGAGGEIFLAPVDGFSLPFLQFNSAGASSVLAFSATGRLPGAPGAEADLFVDFAANVFIQRADAADLDDATFGGISAAAVNFFGNISDTPVDGGNGGPPWRLTSGPITFRDFEGVFSSTASGIGAFTARNFSGRLLIGSGENVAPTGALRFNNLTTAVDGIPTDQVIITGPVASLTVTEDITNTRIRIGGNLGAVAARDMTSVHLTLGGNLASLTSRDLTGVGIELLGSVGAVSLRNLTDTEISFGAAGTSFTAGNFTNSDVTYARGITSFTAGNFLGIGNSVSINQSSLRFGRSVAVNLGNITARLWFNANAHLSTLSINKWDVPESNEQGHGFIRTLSAGSVTVRGVTPAGQTDPNAGRTGGDFYFTGNTGRASTVDSVTINGLFTGQFIAAGSLGAFSARAIDTFDGTRVQPSVIVGGTLRTFSIANTAAAVAPLQNRAAVWARNLTTVNANIGGAGSSFEVAAGALIATPAVLAFLEQEPAGASAIEAFVGWGSGSVGTLNLALRTATTEFVGRFTAGINADTTGPNRNPAGVLQLAEARTTGLNTVSRINTINVSGPATSGGNSLRFGFITYPAAAFTYAGTANTRISPSLPANPPAAIPSTVGFVVPADTFFRLGRPIG